MKIGADIVQLPESGGLSIRFAIDKNRWLIRLRWIYPIFIFVFFGFYIIVSDLPDFRWIDFTVALLLPIIGNVIINFEVNRKVKLPREAQKFKIYTSLMDIINNMQALTFSEFIINHLIRNHLDIKIQ